MARDLEDRLRAGLHDIAELAPDAPPTSAGTSRQTRSTMLIALAAGAAVAAIAVSATLLSNTTDGTPSPDAPPANAADAQNREAAKSAPVPATSGDVVGTWFPIRYAGRSINESGAWDAPPDLILKADGTFTAYDGCNNIVGTYSVATTGRFEFQEHVSRLVFCNNFEPPWATVNATIGEGRLSFLDRDGNVLALYQRN